MSGRGHYTGILLQMWSPCARSIAVSPPTICFTITITSSRPVKIEHLPEGVYLATSDDIPGLVAQGRTVTETLEIARDVAKKLLEARAERQDPVQLKETGDSFDYPLVVSG